MHIFDREADVPDRAASEQAIGQQRSRWAARAPTKARSSCASTFATIAGEPRHAACGGPSQRGLEPLVRHRGRVAHHALHRTGSSNTARLQQLNSRAVRQRLPPGNAVPNKYRVRHRRGRGRPWHGTRSLACQCNRPSPQWRALSAARTERRRRSHWRHAIFGWTDDLPFVLFFPAVIGASILFNHALGLFATARAL
jgi:hypothetical protein